MFVFVFVCVVLLFCCVVVYSRDDDTSNEEEDVEDEEEEPKLDITYTLRNRNGQVAERTRLADVDDDLESRQSWRTIQCIVY